MPPRVPVIWLWPVHSLKWKDDKETETEGAIDENGIEPPVVPGVTGDGTELDDGAAMEVTLMEKKPMRPLQLEVAKVQRSISS